MLANLRIDKDSAGVQLYDDLSLAEATGNMLANLRIDKDSAGVQLYDDLS
jgi:hypothetical protein